MSHPGILERFLHYVSMDTQSSDQSDSFPSTAKQVNLANRLKQELEELGLTDVVVNQWGYLLASLETNLSKKVPTIALLAHLDTSPDVSGANVKPLIHRAYDGRDIVLSKKAGVVLKVSENPYLKEQIGKTLITSDGTTLLGADDKAGIAAIMDAVTFLQANPHHPRPNLRIIFTPDEETGRGVEHLSMEEVKADYGYTVDGERLGEIEDETFCADSVELRLKGINVHPGMAKNKLVNAVKVAAAVIAELPGNAQSPETTEKRQGYLHPHQVSGNVEEVLIKFLIRDFTVPGLATKENLLRRITKRVMSRFPRAEYDFKIIESYRNMKVVLDKHPEVMSKAKQAITLSGIKPKRASIRGGTDGARLCFMGLPTPNLFSGGNNFHSKLEWVALEDMQKASLVLVNLLKLWAEQ